MGDGRDHGDVATEGHLDPVATNPGHYRVVLENESVRVLEYTDEPGTVTTPHDHPDSVMVTLTGFRRRLVTPSSSRDVELVAGQAHWLPAQRHHGENTGQTPTHVLLVELKRPVTGDSDPKDGAGGGGAGAAGATTEGPGPLGPAS